MPQDSFSLILEKIGELHGDIKVLTLSNAETGKKVTTIFNMLNGETPCVIGSLASEAKLDIEKHKERHFSWIKQAGVLIGAAGGVIGIIEWLKTSK